MTTLTPPFGLPIAASLTRGACWGARLIAPDDLLWDRQGCAGDDQAARAAVLDWLQAGAGDGFRANLRDIRHPFEEPVLVYTDDRGTVLARSCGGYVYVVAYLRADD